MTAPLAPAGAGTPPGAARAGSLARVLLEQARPRQWVKNGLVLAAPAAAGELTSLLSIWRVLVALGAFTLAASGTYYVNDLLDREADRHHPVKRHRPVASGRVGTRLAAGTAALLLVAAVAVSLLAGHWQLTATVVAYVGLTTSYSVWLKHEPAVDLTVVAAGFVLRGLGGAAAVEVPVSRWFFIVTTLGALFVVSGKRKAELRALGGQAAQARAAHSRYTISYLDHVQAASSGALIVSYCLWAFERQAPTQGVPFFLLSILPFLIGVLRYALLVDAGAGEQPEEVALDDRPLQLCALAVALLVLLGVS